MKQNWKEFEITNFLGRQTSTNLPDKNASKNIVNFDTREIDGALVSRNGYVKKYDAPTITSFPKNKLSNFSVLSFENFISNGQEITILIAKATLSAASSVSNLPSPSSKNIITIWSSHSWNGSTWTEGWIWLNECILTKINSNGTYGYQKYLDFTTSLANDYFAGWSIVRFETISGTDVEDVAKIIKSSIISGKVYVEITDNKNNWTGNPITLQDGDSILLMRNYIPVTYLEGNYNVERADITFHKIYDQLRIGFGGNADKLGLAVFIKSFRLNIDSVDFKTSYSSAEIEAITGNNKICVAPYTALFDNIELNLSETVGTLAAGTYYFRTSVTLGDDNEVYLKESSITIAENKAINYGISYKLGSENLRAKHFNIYYSDNGEEFFHIRSIDLTDGSVNAHITNSGHFQIDSTIAKELYDPTGLNAAENVSSGDTNATTGWNAENSDTTISSVVSTVSSYALKFLAKSVAIGEYTQHEVLASYRLWFKEPGIFDVSFYAKTDGVLEHLNVGFIKGDSGGVVLTSSYVQHTVRITAEEITEDRGWHALKIKAQSLVLNGATADTAIYIDRISIKKLGEAQVDTDIILGDEIKASLGYSPTRNFIMSWDQCFVTQGRAYFINAFIKERYVNKIFYSAISGLGANSYDVVGNTTGWIDLEKFDGNEIVGADIYSNMDFFIGKKNSVQRVDSQTQTTRDISFGDGVISRRSLVNFGNMLAWASEYGIKVGDEIQIKDITKETIYDVYKSLNKANIIAVRNEKENVYMFYGYEDDIESGSWWLLTKSGWIEFKTADYPQKLSSDKDGNVWFLSEGIIYKFDENVFTDNNITFIPILETVEQDVYKIESLSSKQRFYIRSVWACYEGNVSNLELKLYLDGSDIPANNSNKNLPLSQTLSKKVLRLPVGANCTKFNVIFGSSNLGISSKITLKALGIGYKILGIGDKDDNV